MPVKRRRGKRRINPEAEARAWACMFACGHDFFGDLEDLGFEGNIMERERAAREAAPEAWRRLGRIYLDHDLGRGLAPHDRGEPWALMQFGDPTCQ